jgi:hypothetical protein
MVIKLGMHKNWEKFEDEVLEYLRTNFPQLAFGESAKSDATKGDIPIFNPDLMGYAEVKLCPAQSGQFVVIDENKTFKFSAKNKLLKTIFTDEIIKELNTSYMTYQTTGTAAMPIKVTSKRITEHIVEIYKSKDIVGTIVSTRLDSFKTFVPLEKFKHYFTFNAVLRRKKSGSRKVPKKEFLLSNDLAKLHLIKNEYTYQHNQQTNQYDIEKKLNETECYISEHYYFSLKEENKDFFTYVIRKLSQTANLSVVFSVQYKGPKKSEGWDDFIKEIEKKRT